jgi:hypothetical protein
VRRNEGVGDYAARVAMSGGEPERAFELLETLLAVGNEDRLELRPFEAADGHTHLNGNGLPATNGSGPTSNGHRPRADGSRSDRSRASVSSAD